MKFWISMYPFSNQYLSVLLFLLFQSLSLLLHRSYPHHDLDFLVLQRLFLVHLVILMAGEL